MISASAELLTSWYISPVIFISSKLPLGSGANGAIIHYKPESDSCSTVDGKKLFLLDSGGQYIDGTTDITRTVHFGEPSAREKECFTRVLQVNYIFLPAVIHYVILRTGVW